MTHLLVNYFEEGNRVSEGRKIHTDAGVCHETQTASSIQSVGLVDLGDVGDQKVQASERDLSVQIMVCHVHNLPHLVFRHALRPAQRARELNVRRRERRLPHVVELPEHIWNSISIKVVVDECNNAIVVQN